MISWMEETKSENDVNIVHIVKIKKIKEEKQLQCWPDG